MRACARVYVSECACVCNIEIFDSPKQYLQQCVRNLKLETETHTVLNAKSKHKIYALQKAAKTSFQSVKVAINFWPARNANLGRSKRITYKES